jgi:hypothetical protein
MSAITSSTAMPQGFSPLSRLQSELATEVSSGTIGADDQSALSGALSDIDTAMRSSAPTDGPPSPDAMQSKINSLIANEVSEGKLTSAQADELKNVFAQTFQGGPGGPGGAGGPGGPGGAGCGSDADDASSSAGASSSDTSSSSSDSDVSKLMSDLLKLLQDSQGSTTSYAANGNSLLSQIQSLVVNYQA